MKQNQILVKIFVNGTLKDEVLADGYENAMWISEVAERNYDHSVQNRVNIEFEYADGHVEDL